MTDTSKYLAVLAKTMQNTILPNTETERIKYNKLYSLIHSELYKQLHNSLYPYTSDIIQKTEEMMEEMEPLYILPELIGKKCIAISNHITTNIFNICKNLFLEKEYITIFRKIYTQIPIIIIDDDESSVEILNYANTRVSLTTNELKFLIIESGRKKIALNKIVQFIILKTKLDESQTCIISDNIYADATNIFSRTISRHVACIDNEGLKTINKRHLGCYDTLLMSNELVEQTLNHPIIQKYDCITYSSIYNFIKDNVSPVLYGFADEFLSIKTQIMDYYETQILQSQNITQEVVGDIVRIGNSEDRTLQSIRSYEERRGQTLKSEAQIIESTLKNIEELLLDICADLGENCLNDKLIFGFTYDHIFETFFRCKNFNSNLGKKVLSRLYSLEYGEYNLVTAYIQMLAGKKVTYSPIKIDNFEWEKAKLLLNMVEPDEIPFHLLKSYVRALGEYCDTGKEFYAKSLLATAEEKINLLQESFRKGYEKAGMELLNLYKQGDNTVNLLSLANSLVPEACMIIANQKMQGYQNRQKYADLTDREFTYYKIAASKQYLPAIAKIVDVVFDSRFSSGFQIPLSSKDDERYYEMIDNGYEICHLCRYLIGRMYRVNHYSEILGITLFCLNDDLSGAMNLLSHADSALACYCKGNMYEFGGGVSTDLSKAINYYKRAIRKGMSGRVEKRLAACEDKQERIYIEETINDYYDSDNDYHPSYTTTSSYTYNDGCFTPDTRILMSDGTYCKVSNINVGDSVKAFDHYTGTIIDEKIIANVHNKAKSRKFNVIHITFENGIDIDIVKSHVLFDITLTKYIWLDVNNIKNYIGHAFAIYQDGKIIGNKMIDYNIQLIDTEYFVPISKFHLNVFAENLLTMPPTNLTVNMFSLNKDMTYDLTLLKENGITSFAEISSFVTEEEYENLPCKYLAAILLTNRCDISDFRYAISLYRDQHEFTGIGE